MLAAWSEHHTTPAYHDLSSDERSAASSNDCTGVSSKPASPPPGWTALTLSIAQWHQRTLAPILADAILDRIVHDALRLVLKGEPMRKGTSQLPLELAKPMLY